MESESLKSLLLFLMQNKLDHCIYQLRLISQSVRRTLLSFTTFDLDQNSIRISGLNFFFMVSLGKYMSLQAQVPTTASRLTEILVICSWDQSSSPGNKNSNKTYLVWEGTVLDLLLPSTVRYCSRALFHIRSNVIVCNIQSKLDIPLIFQCHMIISNQQNRLDFLHLAVRDFLHGMALSAGIIICKK